MQASSNAQIENRKKTGVRGSFDLTISFSNENPFESRIIQLLSNRVPVQVGRLRYTVGPGLIKELLVRGAVLLESERPGSMGLQHLLKSEQLISSGTEDSEGYDHHHRASVPKDDPASDSSCGRAVCAQDAGSAVPQQGITSSDLPKMDLKGFDFGSHPSGTREQLS